MSDIKKGLDFTFITKAENTESPLMSVQTFCVGHFYNEQLNKVAILRLYWVVVKLHTYGGRCASERSNNNRVMAIGHSEQNRTVVAVLN